MHAKINDSEGNSPIPGHLANNFNFENDVFTKAFAVYDTQGLIASHGIRLKVVRDIKFTIDMQFSTI
ncbi:hypothetical protein L596_025249 [Steinernema carpocapsae]|uniref:Uncharacterized protein n=1 Tax=Steinernema carpocapsae TaxID=34508 RepID=A0A4U5M7A7_STECR|nr:hypothetical protein L596_025249 [Steinernema carpocapsae]